MYSCPTYKSLSEPVPRILLDCEEERHTLLSVHNEEGRCIAKFPNGNFIFPAELEPQLHKLIGHNIGVLRLDGWHIRDLEAEDAA